MRTWRSVVPAADPEGDLAQLEVGQELVPTAGHDVSPASPTAAATTAARTPPLTLGELQMWLALAVACYHGPVDTIILARTRDSAPVCPCSPRLGSGIAGCGGGTGVPGSSRPPVMDRWLSPRPWLVVTGGLAGHDVDPVVVLMRAMRHTSAAS